MNRTFSRAGSYPPSFKRLPWRTTEARLRLALERMQFGIVEFDTRARMFWTNATAAAMTGDELSAETWLALTGPRYAAWVERIHPDDRGKRELQMRVLDAGDADMVPFEYRVRRADGGWSALSSRYAVVERDAATRVAVHAVGIVMDVTEQVAALTEARTARASLERDLETRKAELAHRHLLLREVYHRMTETLQIVARFFATQAQRAGALGSLEPLWVQRSRIHALGFVHRELMTQVDVATFDVARFLRDLCDAVAESGELRGVSLRVDAADLEVTLDYAIPLGLLVAELLSSCLGHALSQANGQIAVALRRNADAIVLTISADAPAPVDPTRSASFLATLETRFVRDLVGQLGADLRIPDGDGLQAEIAILQLAQ